MIVFLLRLPSAILGAMIGRCIFGRIGIFFGSFIGCMTADMLIRML